MITTSMSISLLAQMLQSGQKKVAYVDTLAFTVGNTKPVHLPQVLGLIQKEASRGFIIGNELLNWSEKGSGHEQMPTGDTFHASAYGMQFDDGAISSKNIVNAENVFATFPIVHAGMYVERAMKSGFFRFRSSLLIFLDVYGREKFYAYADDKSFRVLRDASEIHSESHRLHILGKQFIESKK